MAKNSKYRFFRRLSKKYRLVILNDGTLKERVVIKITLLLVLSATLIISFLLILSAFLLFSYTPLKEYVPGKTSQETQKHLIVMSSKIDSLVLL